MNREDCYDFIREKIMARCGEYETVEEQIKYLRFVLKEKKNNPPEIDENVGLKPSFEEYIQNEIEYREKELVLSKTENGKRKGANKEHELIWWKGTEPMLMYLFQLLYSANLLDDAQIQAKKHSLITGHFKNRFGEPFNNTQLAKSFSRMDKKEGEKKPRSVDTEKIEDVLRDIRKYLKEILEK